MARRAGGYRRRTRGERRGDHVTIPEALRWREARRGEAFTLTTLNVRLLPDGQLAAKAYGGPRGGGRGTYVSFPARTGPSWRRSSQRQRPAPALWAAHRGLR